MGWVKMEENREDNVALTIIHQWMKKYPPADSEEMFTLKLTSYEIAEILADLEKVEPGDVTRELLKNGYKLVRASGGSMKWLIKRSKDNGEQE